MAKCKSPECNMDILWARDESGQSIPLDPIAPVYELTGDGGVYGPRCKRNKNAFVSHFCTCKKPNNFSANKKNGE